MVESLLLLLNTSSGTGLRPGLAGRLGGILRRSLGRVRIEIACVVDHPQASRAARDFVSRTSGRCAVVVGGGNGTVRAAVEGIASALEAPLFTERVVLAALRLGSGNLFARQFGAPADPEAALQGVVDNLLAGRLTRCSLLRCDVEDAGGGRRTLHATSMIGFGSFGEVPGDIERWRSSHPRLRRALARVVGLERLNAVEYAGAFALRALRGVLSRRPRPSLRIVARGRVLEASLLAGAVVKLEVQGIPLRPPVRAEEPTMALAILERPPLGALLRGLADPARLARRAQVCVLSRGEAVRLERWVGPATEFFLDEDPARFDRALTLRVSGELPVAPGPDYRWPGAAEVAS